MSIKAKKSRSHKNRDRNYQSEMEVSDVGTVISIVTELHVLMALTTSRLENNSSSLLAQRQWQKTWKRTT